MKDDKEEDKAEFETLQRDYKKNNKNLWKKEKGIHEAKSKTYRKTT